MMCAITVRDATVLVNNLEIRRRDVANFFAGISQEEIEDAFTKAVEVGVFCLERATAAQDMDFVRRQIDSLVTTVDRRLSAIPSEVESALISKIGMSDGQVLAPIQKLVTNALMSTSDRFNEVKALFNELDPGRDGSATFKAIKSLKDLLDANRKDSVQSAIIAAVTSVTAPEGELAKAVQNRLESGLAPLREEIDRLAKEIRGQDAAIEALSQTTAKGRSFEEEVVIALQNWAAAIGAQLEHVGTDNRPGDVVINIPRSDGTGLRLAIEARDRQAPRGRKVISETLEAVMVERKTQAAIYLSRDKQGLANEMGEWAEGGGKLVRKRFSFNCRYALSSASNGRRAPLRSTPLFFKSSIVHRSKSSRVTFFELWASSMLRNSAAVSFPTSLE